MNIIKLAWNNLWHNKKRTILNLILLSVSISALILIRGYMNYTKEGLIFAASNSKGAIEIAHKSYWDLNSEKVILLKDNDIKKIKEEVKKIEGVKNIQRKIYISGIIGTENKSSFFTGEGYEDVSSVLSSVSIKSGEPLFDNDIDNILIGEGLGEILNVKNFQYINIMSDISDGISVSSFKVSGTVTLNDINADKFFVIFPLNALYNSFNIEKGDSHSLILYLEDNYKATEVKNRLNSYFINNNLPYFSKDWRELNPYIISILKMNDQIYFFAFIILAIVVFISVTQTLTTSFLERIGEFGTIRSIGLNIRSLTFMLFLETIFLVLLSNIIGIFISNISSYIIQVLEIRFIPPGSSDGYILNIIFEYKDYIAVSFSIFIVAILASAFPVYKTIKLPIIEVIKYV